MKTLHCIILIYLVSTLAALAVPPGTYEAIRQTSIDSGEKGQLLAPGTRVEIGKCLKPDNGAETCDATTTLGERGFVFPKDFAPAIGSDPQALSPGTYEAVVPTALEISEVDAVDISPGERIEVTKCGLQDGVEMCLASFQGDQGKTHAQDFRVVTPRPEATHSGLAAGMYHISPGVKNGYLELRDGPFIDGIEIERIPAGTSINIGRCIAASDGVSTKPWCQATVGKQKGWVSSCCIIATTPPVPSASDRLIPIDPEDRHSDGGVTQTPETISQTFSTEALEECLESYDAGRVSQDYDGTFATAGNLVCRKSSIDHEDTQFEELMFYDGEINDGIRTPDFVGVKVTRDITGLANLDALSTVQQTDDILTYFMSEDGEQEYVGKMETEGEGPSDGQIITTREVKAILLECTNGDADDECSGGRIDGSSIPASKQAINSALFEAGRRARELLDGGEPSGQ